MSHRYNLFSRHIQLHDPQH